MMWIVMKPKPGYTADSNCYRDLIDEVIEPALRRVEEPGSLLPAVKNGSGGASRSQSFRIAITINDVTNALRNNRDIRAVLWLGTTRVSGTYG